VDERRLSVCQTPASHVQCPEAADRTTNETEERNEGGLANYTPFKPDERTQDLTNIKRAWPGAGAIQRTDGTMEAFIEIDPGNMDFAMSDDWAQLQNAGEDFANKGTRLEAQIPRNNPFIPGRANHRDHRGTAYRRRRHGESDLPRTPRGISRNTPQRDA